MMTSDGKVLAGATPAEVVAELRAMSMEPSRSDTEFMRTAAGRALLQTGHRVRHGNAEEFVADLIEVGLLVEE